jgi:hypothetical protein
MRLRTRGKLNVFYNFAGVMNILYLPLNGYLAEWAKNRFGSPLVFPPRSYENALIARNISKRPKDAQPVTTKKSDGFVGIVVPTIHGRDWTTYNYLPRRGCAQIIEALEWLFRIDLWQSMIGSFGTSHFARDLDEWRRNRGIHLDHLYALDKKLYRMKKDYENANRIILGRVYSKKKNTNNTKSNNNNTD